MALNLASPLSMQMFYPAHRMALYHYADEMAANGWSPVMNSLIAGPSLSENVKVELENEKLWQQFHAETTEMIITKTGRRMFPSIQLSVQGLEKKTCYCVLLELMSASDRRHKYIGAGDAIGTQKGPKGWTSAGPMEPQPALERRIYVHPDSPATGSHWMQHPLSFSKLKLTNNVVESHNNILLTSMHKYIPRIWIVRCDVDITNTRDLYNYPSAQFTFKETAFIAVTAYQNENVKQLKINNNPFAKGFRENGQSSCKRKRMRLSNDDPTCGSGSGNSSHDEEEGNVSSSDSEACDRPVKKARMHSEDAYGCGSNGPGNSATPPSSNSSSNGAEEPTRREPAQQPRLHRPWTDDDDEDQIDIYVEKKTSQEEPLLPFDRIAQMALRMPQQHPHGFLGMQTTHYHLVALELARMRQLQQNYVMAAQQLTPEYMDFRL